MIVWQWQDGPLASGGTAGDSEQVTTSEQMEGAGRWRTRETRELFEAILALETIEEAERFFRDLCTLGEIEAMTHRWQAARLVSEGLPYHEVSRRTGASTTTVTRWRSSVARAGRAAEGRGSVQGTAARARGRVTRGRRSRSRAAGRACARVPLPQCPRRGSARASRRHPRVRPGRRR